MILSAAKVSEVRGRAAEAPLSCLSHFGAGKGWLMTSLAAEVFQVKEKGSVF